MALAADRVPFRRREALADPRLLIECLMYVCMYPPPSPTVAALAEIECPPPRLYGGGREGDRGSPVPCESAGLVGWTRPEPDGRISGMGVRADGRARALARDEDRGRCREEHHYHHILTISLSQPPSLSLSLRHHLERWWWREGENDRGLCSGEHFGSEEWLHIVGISESIQKHQCEA